MYAQVNGIYSTDKLLEPMHSVSLVLQHLEILKPQFATEDLLLQQSLITQYLLIVVLA